MSGISFDQRTSYKLIPQLNSEESEFSEEEVERFYENGFQIITKKNIQPSFYDELDTADLNFTSQSDFSIMNPESNTKTTRSNSTYSYPAIRESLSEGYRTMSKERKISIFFYIAVSLALINFFLMMPCHWSTCECVENREKNFKIWSYVFPDKEIKGEITLVKPTFGKHHNLLFMARGSILMDSPLIRSDLTSSNGGDLLLLNGLSGKQIWRKHFNRIPVEIDCSLIRLANRSVDECVLLSQGNFVRLVSSDEGKDIWKFAGNSGKYNREYFQFPVVLPDLDGDGVRELTVIKDFKQLLIYSVSSESPLSNLTNNDCNEISHLKYIEGLNLSYLCTFKNDSSQRVNVSLKHYIEIPPQLKKNARVPQHIPRNSNETEINGHRIVVHNEGTFCPNNCSSKIDIIDDNNMTVWTHESLDSYVMKPVAFSFNNSDTFGFVFKIWEHEYEGDEMKNLKISQHGYQYTVGYIYERTVIVVFNSPFGEPLQTINMSLNPILQLQETNEKLQPNPKNQDNSLLLLDVGKNGTYQLVTYYSTFKEVKKNYHMDSFARSHYTLKSYVQMFDLKKEIIKKLFDFAA